MVVVSYSGKEINAKLVYYGPGLSGKTTNLEYIYQSVPTNNRGKMVSMKTRTERTLFFDFLPVDLGEMGGFKTRFLLYTVPGQVYYNATRKLVLRGVDAIIFVADSARGKMDENVESLQNLQDNLKEYGLNVEEFPLVLQYNKRDVDDPYTVEELESALNPRGLPYFEAVATTGQGVFETFRGISQVLLQKLSKEVRLGETRATDSKPTPRPAPAAAVKPTAPPSIPTSSAPRPPAPAMSVPAAPRAEEPSPPPLVEERLAAASEPIRCEDPPPPEPIQEPVAPVAEAVPAEVEEAPVEALDVPFEAPRAVEAPPIEPLTLAPERAGHAEPYLSEVDAEVSASSWEPSERRGGFWRRFRHRKPQSQDSIPSTAPVLERELAPVEIPAVGGSGDFAPVTIERRIQVPITLGPDEVMRGARLRLVLEIKVEAATEKNSKVA
jgi:signal recognition particle receptor subunit beta